MNRNTFRPQLESLDGRIVPAVLSITQNVATGVATIAANSANDTITITDRGTGGLTVSGTGISQQTLDTRINHVVLNTNGGSDTVTYNLTGVIHRSVNIEANLGAGNDKFTANQNGFNVASHSNEIIAVNGAAGADRITINAGKVNGSTVDINSGSSLQLKLTAGSNTDLSDGGDAIAVNYEGILDGDLRLRAIGGLGADTLSANVTLDSGSDGFVRGFSGAKASLEGGIGADTLDFRVRDNSGGTGRVSAIADVGLDLDHDTARHTANVLSAFTFGDDDQIVS